MVRAGARLAGPFAGRYPLFERQLFLVFSNCHLPAHKRVPYAPAVVAQKVTPFGLNLPRGGTVLDSAHGKIATLAVPASVDVGDFSCAVLVRYVGGVGLAW